MGFIAAIAFGPLIKGVTRNCLIAGRVFFLTFSCIDVTSAAERFNFEHFSISIPENDVWKTLPANPNQNVYVASIDKVNYQITLLENVFTGSSSVNNTAQSIADDYRENEKQGMIELGVKRGLYELFNVTMGESMVGDKLFYTMTYTTKASSGFKSIFESAELYLYFPNKNYVQEFFVAHYAESASKQKKLTLKMEPDFLDLLESLSVRDTFSVPAGAGTSKEDVSASAVPTTMFALIHQAEEAFRQKPRGQRSKACGVKLEKSDRFDQGSYLNLFVDTEQSSKIDVVTLSNFDASKLFERSNAMNTPAFGQIYDRNQDGRVDYLMYNIGFGIMAAPECYKGTKEDYGLDVENMMTRRFWHVLDENFDGQNDTILSRLLAEGWYDGWILAQDTDFDGAYETCIWYPRKLGEDPQVCEADGDRFSAPARDNQFPVSIPAIGKALDVVIDAASRCKLVKKGKADFFASPEQYIGKPILIDNSCPG